MSGSGPTQAGFLDFLRNVVGIPVGALPDDSVYIGWAYNMATEVVYEGFNCVAPTVYMVMVYNLGAHNIFCFAQDPLNGPTIQLAGQKSPLPYFQAYRQEWRVNSFISGVVQSTFDQGTGTTVVVPESLKNLTLADLQYLKTPYGAQYLALAQSAGSLWGLTQ